MRGATPPKGERISAKDTPLVTLGVPVYNAEPYVGDALESLVAQTYSNLEIVVSDNASTDETSAICRELVARDRRVRYHRLERNLGAIWNFDRVRQLACGQYFMWAAHDDVRHPEFVERCVRALEACPSAVLCCTGVRLINEAGDEIDDPVYADQPRPVGLGPAERALALARAWYWYDFYGLIRRDALEAIRPLRPVWGFDVVALLELCLRGDVVLLPEKLFSYRLAPAKGQAAVAAGLGQTAARGGIRPSWTRLSVELGRGLWAWPAPYSVKAPLLARFLWTFCVENELVRSGMRLNAGMSTERFVATLAGRVVTESEAAAMGRAVRTIAARLVPAGRRTRTLASARSFSERRQRERRR